MFTETYYLAEARFTSPEMLYGPGGRAPPGIVSIDLGWRDVHTIPLTDDMHSPGHEAEEAAMEAGRRARAGNAKTVPVVVAVLCAGAIGAGILYATTGARDTRGKPRPPEVGKASGEAEQPKPEPRPESPAPPVDEALRPSLDRVVARCPKSYPDIVTPLPESGGFSDKDIAELMGMLGNWNPALRAEVSNELARRGEAVIPKLKEALRSEDGKVRAGAAKALSGIVRDQMRNWKEHCPGVTDGREAQDKIRSKHAGLVPELLRLFKDPERDVREAALNCISSLQIKNREVISAMLELCADKDEFVAQNAMLTLEKRFGVDPLDPRRIVAGLKAAMKGPLPRGKGHVIRLISRLDESIQREFIPEYLALLDWQPDRDTMFGAGGQEQAMRLLTKFRVKELVPRIPKLLDKTMRGPGLFAPGLECAMEFGSDAKVILPELKEYQKRLERDLEKAGNSRHAPGIRERLEKMRKAVEHVESM